MNSCVDCKYLDKSEHRECRRWPPMVVITDIDTVETHFPTIEYPHSTVCGEFKKD